MRLFTTASNCLSCLYCCPQDHAHTQSFPRAFRTPGRGFLGSVLRMHSWIHREGDTAKCGRIHAAFPKPPLSPGGVTAHSIPAVKMQYRKCDVSAQGSPLEVQHPRCLLGAGPTCTLYLAHTEFRVCEGEQVFSITTLLAQMVEAVSHSYQLGNSGTTRRHQPRAGKGELTAACCPGCALYP